jgi:exodeoxyribonuclease V alpha subunit
MLKARQKLKALLSWLVALRFAVLHYANKKSLSTITKQEAVPTGSAKEILRVLKQGLAQGHTCLSRHEAWRRLHPQGVSAEELTAALLPLRESGWIDFTENTISLSPCAHAESLIAESLTYIGCGLQPIQPRLLMKWMQEQDVQLSEEQQAAIRLLSAAPVAILTGDPGTGKTSTIKAFTDLFRQAGYDVYLTAPTGRAAARLAEATGNEAQTLHRFLHTRRSHDRTLRELFTGRKEITVVDEASMLDLFLAERLVSVCTPRTRLIFVGDPHQLPPVGAGQVLRDLLRSGVLPVATLTTCFRQTEQSRIIAAAQSIKQGCVPELAVPGQEKSDCYFIEADSPAEIQQLVIRAVTASLPARCGADPYSDIQVLTPMQNGLLGTVHLNQAIRRALHPFALSAETKQFFCCKDRVLNIRNNYSLGVFNGECGSVADVTDDKVCVRYGEREVTYHKAALDDLTHGFAMTIHRAQGSEYPFVVIPLHESQTVMLTRELLYTALTRGRRMVVLIGSRRALAHAIANDYSSQRCTRLSELLTASFARTTTKAIA